MDVLEAIRTRRSVRQYQARPVDAETLRAVLEAARWAPSWANTQCTRYTVVQDPALKAALIDTFSEKNPARRGAADAPVMVAVSARKGLAGYYHGGPVTDQGDAWTMFDVALAIQNLTLAAHALGLGTVQVGYFDMAKAARLLEIPPDEVMVELIPLGWPAHEPAVPARLLMEELVRWR